MATFEIPNPRRPRFLYPGGVPPQRTAVLVPWFAPAKSSGASNWQARWKLLWLGPKQDRDSGESGQPGRETAASSSVNGPVRTFRTGWCAEAARWEPQAIAGSWEQLLSLASQNDCPELTHAVIVLERQSDGLLTEADRNRLWRAFGVPIFEQVISDGGELLASECEAHCGLHIQVTEFAFDIDTDRDSRRFVVETARCACGRENPRLVMAPPVEFARAVVA